MAEATIETLAIEINSNANASNDGIDALATSLTKLKSAVKGGVGLTTTSRQFERLEKATEGIAKSNARIERLAKGLNALGSVGKPQALTSTLTQLQKIPKLIKDLDNKTLSDFERKIYRITMALKPLSHELAKVSHGFQHLPKNIGRTVTQVNRLSRGNHRGAGTFTDLWAKARMTYNAIQAGTRVFGYSIAQSNAYIEDMNLFSVALGKYADEAQKYAWKVGELLGIDPREWMRNQGVFMTITEGFGVASDRAYTMSKNLTQLGYDLSSFYNISFEDAMTKLTSGIAGELEPLRRLGYDLSVARLQQEAYKLGITKTVQEMTQAEKAQLRYYAIMTQVTTSHGDMARTIEAPANQLRILKAQVIQLARAFGNILVPVLNIVLPYLVAFTKVVREALETLAKFLHVKLPEFDLSDVVRGKKEMQGIGSGVDDISKGLGKAAKKAKELKNATLGIDELNVISPPEDTAGAGGRGAGIGGVVDSGLDFPLPEYDFLKGLESKGDEIVNKVKKIIGVLEAIVTGALFTLGVVMCILGHPVYGVAMMIAGFTGMTVMTLNGNKLPDTVKKALSQVMSIVGGMALALGAFLIAVGSFPVGVALVVAGASMLVGAATLNFGLAKGKVKQFLMNLMQVISGGILVLGVCLLWLGGTLPLAIALIAAGAVGLVSTVALNWNKVREKVSSVLKKLINIIKKVGLLALGVILCLSGVGVPLGIAIIKKASGNLANSTSIDWNGLKDKVKSHLDKISKNMRAFQKEFERNPIKVSIGLIKKGWSTIKKWIGDIPFLNQAICLIKKGWDTVKNWIGKIPFIDQGITLAKKGWSYVSSWVDSFWKGDVWQKISLSKVWSTVTKWVDSFRDGSVWQKIALWSGWSSIYQWFSQTLGTKVSVTIDFITGKVKDGWGRFKGWVSDVWSRIWAENGGIITANGVQPFANGGFGKHGKMNTWNGIPAYAGGGKPHGSMFMAGENGAELVGHVGGQTEVLNRSQIATVILNSTIQGMAQFLPAWNGIYAQVAAIREERLSDSMIYSGVNYKAEDDGYTLRQFAEEFFPLMRNAEEGVRKQADKDENITVRIGAREIDSEIQRQRKADGYSFAY